MSKNIDIYKAIKSLPDDLITTEIWEAGIKEGNIKILNLLPKDYMTDENINSIIDNEKNKSDWDSFSLSSIPENARTQKVCDAAVIKSMNNFPIVPEDKRSTNMLHKMAYHAENYIHYFPLFAKDKWDINTVYIGVKSTYNYGESNNYRGRHSYSMSNSSDKSKQMRLVQVFLSMVPENLLDGAFYLGLFKFSLTTKDIDFLTPNKYKSPEYYLEVGKRKIKDVPVSKLSYDIIKAALQSDTNNIYSFIDEESPIREKLWKVMDDDIADIIINDTPSKLSELPSKFHTKSRLISALEAGKSRDAKEICGKFDINQFDDEICRAIVRRNDYSCPKFARHIWTTDFIQYCMENATGYNWFKVMQKELQTQEMVDVILNSSISDIEHTRVELISYDLAVKAFRYQTSSYGDNQFSYRKYVPKHYLEDFQLQTGLPVEFFGGETTYLKLRENRADYHYCQIGEACVGFFIDKDNYGREKYNRLIMTRRNPMQFKPTIVFNRVIQTFHVSWFEKMIADSDPRFTIPVPGKGLKGHQRNKYMGINHVETMGGIKIYSHSLMGATVLYEADGYVGSTLEEVKSSLEPKGEEVIDEYEIAC